jgi:predicted DsbA family dithiol-disulfide isomerase
LASGRHAERVQQDVDNAKATGAGGTPWSIVIVSETGEKYPIEGAYPYASMKQIIDSLLR